MTDNVFPKCGHPKSPENMKCVGERNGVPRFGCRICQRATNLRYMREVRALETAWIIEACEREEAA